MLREHERLRSRPAGAMAAHACSCTNDLCQLRARVAALEEENAALRDLLAPDAAAPGRARRGSDAGRPPRPPAPAAAAAGEGGGGGAGVAGEEVTMVQCYNWCVCETDWEGGGCNAWRMVVAV